MQKDNTGGSSKLSSQIDNALDKFVRWESTFEETITSPERRERPAPRGWQIAVAAVCGLFSIFLVLAAIWFAGVAVEKGRYELGPLTILVLLPLLVATFLGTTSYRLFRIRKKAISGTLFSPAMIIAIGVFFVLAGIWMKFQGEGDSVIVIFGLAILSTGISLRRRSMAKKSDNVSLADDD